LIHHPHVVASVAHREGGTALDNAGPGDQRSAEHALLDRVARAVVWSGSMRESSDITVAPRSDRGRRAAAILLVAFGLLWAGLGLVGVTNMEPWPSLRVLAWLGVVIGAVQSGIGIGLWKRVPGSAALAILVGVLGVLAGLSALSSAAGLGWGMAIATMAGYGFILAVGGRSLVT
jgi:peptidoglycan/LPS O-acetylase OafA/YrhL